MNISFPFLIFTPFDYYISNLDDDISSAESDGRSDLMDQYSSNETSNIRTVAWTSQVRREKKEALSRIKSAGRSADLIRIISGLAIAIIPLTRAFVFPIVVLSELSVVILINLCASVFTVCKYIRYRSILKEFKKQAFDYPYRRAETDIRTRRELTTKNIEALMHNTGLVVETMRLREEGHDIPALSFDDPRLIRVPSTM